MKNKSNNTIADRIERREETYRQFKEGIISSHEYETYLSEEAHELSTKDIILEYTEEIKNGRNMFNYLVQLKAKLMSGKKLSDSEFNFVHNNLPL